jgi:hypothetical protein
MRAHFVIAAGKKHSIDMLFDPHWQGQYCVTHHSGRARLKRVDQPHLFPLDAALLDRHCINQNGRSGNKRRRRRCLIRPHWTLEHRKAQDDSKILRSGDVTRLLAWPQQEASIHRLIALAQDAGFEAMVIGATARFSYSSLLDGHEPTLLGFPVAPLGCRADQIPAETFAVVAHPSNASPAALDYPFVVLCEQQRTDETRWRLRWGRYPIKHGSSSRGKSRASRATRLVAFFTHSL